MLLRNRVDTCLGKYELNTLKYRVYYVSESSLVPWECMFETFCILYRSGVDSMYDISYMWAKAGGILVTTIVAVIISLITSKLKQLKIYQLKSNYYKLNFTDTAPVN